MVRLTSPKLNSKFMAIALLVTSVFVALVVNVGLQDSGTTSVPVEQYGEAPAASDDVTLMQEVAVVERFSVSDKAEDTACASPGASDDMTLMQGVAQVQPAPSDDMTLMQGVARLEILSHLDETPAKDTATLVQSAPQLKPVEPASIYAKQLETLAKDTAAKPVEHASIYEKQLEMLAKDTPASAQSTPKAKELETPAASLQSTPKAKESGTLAKDTAASVQSTAQAKPSYLAMLDQQLHASLVRSIGSTGLVILLVALSGIVLFCLASLLFRMRGQQAGQNKDIAAAIEQRERMLEHTRPVGGPSGYLPGSYQHTASGANLRSGNAVPQNPRAPASGPFLPASGPFLPASSSVRTSLDPSSGRPSTSCTSITDQRLAVRPPPLCPTLVMPMSEALLGIQMYELAQLNQEGSLNIIGVSGKPLLRAEVKKVGTFRTLYVSMPDANSIPRASVSPPTSVEAQLQLGSRAMEIRGMRGAFYGILQMQSSGACYVVKDGQTVLTIDGDAESLQLGLMSSNGMQLASVKCSTEQFEGVDHVEIHVEPGVDTVLVVSVVLAVLLLSPYLPHPEDD